MVSQQKIYQINKTSTVRLNSKLAQPETLSMNNGINNMMGGLTSVGQSTDTYFMFVVENSSESIFEIWCFGSDKWDNALKREIIDKFGCAPLRSLIRYKRRDIGTKSQNPLNKWVIYLLELCIIQGRALCTTVCRPLWPGVNWVATMFIRGSDEELRFLQKLCHYQQWSREPMWQTAAVSGEKNWENGAWQELSVGVLDWCQWNCGRQYTATNYMRVIVILICCTNPNPVRAILFVPNKWIDFPCFFVVVSASTLSNNWVGVVEVCFFLLSSEFINFEIAKYFIGAQLQCVGAICTFLLAN